MTEQKWISPNHRGRDIIAIQEALPDEGGPYEIGYSPARFDYEITRQSDDLSVTLHKEDIYTNTQDELVAVIEKLFKKAEDDSKS
jgi:hypothetical protein